MNLPFYVIQITTKVKKLSAKFLVLLLTVSLFSCKTTKIADRPAESYLPTSISPALSELPVQVELDIKKLEAAINKKMTGLIYEGNNVADKDLQVKVWKAQNFTFSVNGNVVEYRVPLKIWSRFTWKISKFGMTVSDNYDATGSIALTYKTAITLDRNWKLVAKTTSSGFQWIETPKISVVGVNVPVTPIANLALSKCDKLISDQIDKSLSDAVDIKKQLSKAWGEVQKPMLVNAENQMWLKVTPRDVYVSPFVTQANKLNLSIAIYSQIESLIGAQPVVGNPTPLPEFKYITRPAQQFNLNLAADITFDKISEMTKKQLLNKTFADGGKSITLVDLKIYGSQGKAVFAADVTGSLKGKIYFTGNMTYNATKNALEITNPEFDLSTGNLLAKSANWLLHGMILSKITPYLTYPLKDDLENAKTEANKVLGSYNVYNGVSLQGKLNTITVNDISLVPGAVRAKVSMKGNVAIKLNDLQF